MRQLSYFVSLAHLKWKDERKRFFLQARREVGGVGGVAGNWLVKVYKQSEEEVQEAEW